MFIAKLSYWARSFREDIRGNVAVEAVILLPVLWWSFMAMAVFFDMYRAKSTTEKAAFTVSDMLSRETAAVDDDYLESARSLFSEISTLDEVGALTVSLIAWNGVTNEYFLDWSNSTVGGAGGIDNTDLALIEHNLPELVSGERLILVQTTGEYESPLNIGLGAIDMSTFVFTRPRFAPQLAWSNS